MRTAIFNSLSRSGSMRSFRIDSGGVRLGIYYLEKGASQRGGLCVYDRKHSAIQQAQPADFQWEEILSGAEWFHFSGITPALSPSALKHSIEGDFNRVSVEEVYQLMHGDASGRVKR